MSKSMHKKMYRKNISIKMRAAEAVKKTSTKNQKLKNQTIIVLQKYQTKAALLGINARVANSTYYIAVRIVSILLCINVYIYEFSVLLKLGFISPVLKKGDAIICSNYSGISLLTIAYRILSSVLCERLKPFVNKLIGTYQCSFRPGKSTIDQIFTLRQILEKTRDKQINTFHLFVEFKSAFNTPHRDHLYATMSELGIPAKLIRLCEMTLNNAQCVVKIGTTYSSLLMPNGASDKVIAYPAIHPTSLLTESSAHLA